MTQTSYSENLLVHFKRIESLKREALAYPSYDLNARQLCDLELLLNRAYYPLDGYMGRRDYESVLETMRLCDGALFPMPVSLSVPKDLAEKLAPGGPLALRDQEGFMLAVLTVEEIWRVDLKHEAQCVFGAVDGDAHPGVRHFFEQETIWRVGGRVEGLYLPQHYDFIEHRLTPAETHRHFSQRGWRKVIGMQTSRFPHCSHREMMLKASREAGASIFLQPIVGQLRSREAEYFTRVRCYEAFLKHFPRNMIALGLTPHIPRMAGPREALFQAIVQRNYGCTHFMVADDHADPFAEHNGAPRFYPRKAAQELVAEHADETGVAMAPQERMVYVEDVARYIPEQDATDSMEVKEISSAELLRRLEFDLDVPSWFSFPEVVEEMKRAFPPRHSQGFTLLLTGLSGAGKSTLAKVLYVKFMEMRDRPVTLLDGDIVRRNLSSELRFSKEHRNLNVIRIGFVASEITKNRGIAICAPIAPYEESRSQCREMISQYGGYVEVHMATPLTVCEQRDRKGIYAKARAGIMKGVTGIDDPYEPPLNPDLVVDTSEMSPTEAAQEVLLFLEDQGYIR